MTKHNVYQFYAELKDYKPKIWRRFEINGGKSMAELAYTVMIMFEMHASHLFELTEDDREALIKSIRVKYDQSLADKLLVNYKSNGKTIYNLNPEDAFYDQDQKIVQPNQATINQMVPLVGTKLNLAYDFGDDWNVEFKLEKITKKEVSLKILPRVLDGQGFGIIEDIGGVDELENVATILKQGHGEEYVGLVNFLDAKDLDLNAIDIDDVNFRIKKLLRVYREAYEDYLPPTEKSMKILLRDYLNKGSKGY